MCSMTGAILNILLCVLLGAYAGISLILMGMMAKWAWNSMRDERNTK